MKASLSWLKDYVKIQASAAELAERLTMAGLEVEKQEKKFGDTTFEFEITPNRPDCLSVLGLAREVSAIFDTPLSYPKGSSRLRAQTKIHVKIEDRKGCLKYIGILLENVSVKESAGWMQKRLASVDLRPINSAVDVTNFCLMELGQPLHVFDYDKLLGRKIVVRRAKEGERIVTLDGVDRLLEPSILVIADEQRPVAIAGIMGGQDTAVDAHTKNILLESAFFDPILIRRAGRTLGISTDSSYRFERGVDASLVLPAALRAVSLLKEACSGALRGYTEVSGSFKVKVRKTAISLAQKQIEEVLGVDIPLSKSKKILRNLGFEIKEKRKGVLSALSPTHRRDVSVAEDLIEEIVRTIGYDRIPTKMPSVKVTNFQSDSRRSFRASLIAPLLSCGLNEVVSYSLVPREFLTRSQFPFQDVVRLQNPLSQEQELMRPSLLPCLMSLAEKNFSKGQRDLKLFEVAHVYRRQGETESLGILLSGFKTWDWRKAAGEKWDFFDLKGILGNVLAAAGVGGVFLGTEHPFFEKKQAAGVLVNGQEIGVLGQVSSAVMGAWDIKGAGVFAAEINVTALGAFGPAAAKRYQPPPGFPPISRDISLAVKEEIPFSDVYEGIRAAGSEFLADVRFVEEYRGDKISPGYKGWMFALTYQSFRATLREEEVSREHQDICRQLTTKFGAVIR